MTVRLRCPVRGCGLDLERETSRVVCASGHAFDIAKSGYIGLMQPQDRKSKSPGDSAPAVVARRRMVERGIEARIVAEIAGLAASTRSAGSGVLLDAGCGEGSVTMALSVATGYAPVGVDISTAAVERAAKRYPTATWIAANADREMPFADGSFAMVTSIVARRNVEEFARLLEPGGVCLVVVPGTDDLGELRAAVLGKTVDRDRTGSVEVEFIDGAELSGSPPTRLGPPFELLGRRHMRDRVRLDRAAIEDALASTYRGARLSQQMRLTDLDALDVTLSREALVFRRRT